MEPTNEKSSEEDEIKSIEIICTDPYKAAMLQALIHSLGIVSHAAEVAGISRQTHYNWLKTDSEYRAVSEQINDAVLDIAESKLYKMMKESDFRAVMFILRTRGRSRGYSMFKESVNTLERNISIIVASPEDAERAKKTLGQP